MEEYRFGDMLALASFVNEHRAALIADFQREYGLNLEEEVENKISSSRMEALVKGLGPGTALYRELNPHFAWENTQELLAVIVELLDRQDRHFVMANSESGKAWDPIKIPRPYDNEEKERKGTTMAELKELIAGAKRSKEGGES